jgi:MerR family transcriptional regulator/heat shock protein HspR
MKVNRKKGFFSISAVAKMFSVHQQTVRLYEKQGLISPGRSEGNTRLFSEEDINRLEEVIYLTHELGINLAGVEMILKLKKQINRLQKDMNKAFESTQKELEKEALVAKENIQSSSQKLASMGKKSALSHKKKATENSTQLVDPSTTDSWQIKYEDE